MNLLKELKEKLKEHGKSIKDIKWIGNKNCKVDIETFLKLANTEYDNRIWST